MRIDEINLLGQFKITGNTGNNSQAIGMSGGSTSFIDVVAGGGSSAGLVKRSGYNYVIVEATGDALANGVKLGTAYTEAVALLGQIGTPAPDNRVSILLTPGDYDLGGDYLLVNTSYIDIVGISQNPLDTIIRASNEFTTIRFDSGMDFGLYNIDLRSGGIDQQVAFWDGGAIGSTYLRMKNVVISGNGFFDSVTSYYSFYDLDGEFEDITVLDGCNFAVASNTVTGTFKNIKIGDVPYAFYGLTTLTGTYKNITISNLNNYGFYSSNVSGIFENIKINGGSNIFPNITSGYFKNIIISGSPTTVFTPAPGTGGIFEDIEISTAQDAFVGPIDGTFKNIKIGDGVVNVFNGGTGNILGTFSNIEIGNASGAFSDAANISGSFKDIKVGNVSSIFSSNTDLTGTYENITMGDVDGGSCFTTGGGNISGTFKNITVGNNVSSFFTSATDLSGTFENIKSGDVLTDAFLAGNSILGTFKKISIKGGDGNFFQAVGSDINGVFDDIYNGNTGTYTFFTDSGILTGTFSNIELVNCGRSFLGNGTSGYYDGITIGNSSQFIFAGITTGTYKNIKIGSCTSFFTSGNDLGAMSPTLVENIEVGESGNFIDSGDALGGTYKNIKVGSITGDAFSAELGITGTYSNIEVGSCTGDMFSSGTNLASITVNVDNLFVGTVSTIFDPGPVAVGYVGSKFNKMDITGNCFGYALSSKQFAAKLTNSRINMIGRNDAMFLAGGQIERCKILTDASTMSGSGQVIYTMTNYSNTVSGATQCISDTSITS